MHAPLRIIIGIYLINLVGSQNHIHLERVLLLNVLFPFLLIFFFFYKRIWNTFIVNKYILFWIIVKIHPIGLIRSQVRTHLGIVFAQKKFLILDLRYIYWENTRRNKDLLLLLKHALFWIIFEIHPIELARSRNRIH